MLVSYYLVAEGFSGIIYNNKGTRNFLAQLRISGVMSYHTVKCLLRNLHSILKERLDGLTLSLVFFGAFLGFAFLADSPL